MKVQDSENRETEVMLAHDTAVKLCREMAVLLSCPQDRVWENERVGDWIMRAHELVQTVDGDPKRVDLGLPCEGPAWLHVKLCRDQHAPTCSRKAVVLRSGRGYCAQHDPQKRNKSGSGKKSR